MGGKPVKWTPADRRLKENKNRPGSGRSVGGSGKGKSRGRAK